MEWERRGRVIIFSSKAPYRKVARDSGIETVGSQLKFLRPGVVSEGWSDGGRGFQYEVTFASEELAQGGLDWLDVKN